VPRARTDSPWFEGSEVDRVIAALMEDGDRLDPLCDPEHALEWVRRGDLGDEEREVVRVRALEVLRYVEQQNHLEEIGAVVTSPRSAREGMRARREADAEGWRVVLAALGA
jgi:hypothetical protein